MDKKEAGVLNIVAILTDSAELEVRVQLDGQPSPSTWLSINQLGELSFDERIHDHFYITRWDVGASRFAILYESDPPEPYQTRLRIALRNPPNSTVANINLLWSEVKRTKFTPSESEENR